jgi:hypothetical protein
MAMSLVFSAGFVELGVPERPFVSLDTVLPGVNNLARFQSCGVGSGFRFLTRLRNRGKKEAQPCESGSRRTPFDLTPRSSQGVRERVELESA